MSLQRDTAEVVRRTKDIVNIVSSVCYSSYFVFFCFSTVAVGSFDWVTGRWSSL